METYAVQSTHSLASLSSSLFSDVVIPVIIPSIGQIDLFEILRILIEDEVLTRQLSKNANKNVKVMPFTKSRT